mmetsp:Transcript_64356/g.97009  ORF Transcript_64356/g.97009 Transcript_64356/m.97009 type:complete len:241 (-) Transcript_64356:121-843(-)
MTILSYSSVVSTFLLALSSSITTTPVNAYPTGAGTCLTGDGAPVGHGGALQGSLEDSGNFQISLWDNPLGGDSQPNYVPGEDYVLKIEGLNGATFKGFLLRASGEEDLSGSLSNPTAGTDFQIMESTGEATGAFPNPGTCAEDVGGACHTAANGLAFEKTSVEVTFTPPGDRPVLLELTIMVTGSLYHYSSYTMTIEGDDTTTTDAPSVTPEDGGDGSAATSVYAVSQIVILAMAMCAIF